MPNPAIQSSLATLTRQAVQQLADSPATFQRGERYLRAGAIRKYTVSATGITAQVRGNQDDYAVTITAHPDGLRTLCSCPYDGSVCKHIVAVLLRFVETSKPGGDTEASGGPVRIDDKTTLEELNALVAGLHARRQPAKAPASGTSTRDAALFETPQHSRRLLEVFRRAGALSPMFAKARYGIEQAGKTLFQQGKATVRYADGEYANIDVQDAVGHLYQVSMSRGNGTLRGISLACNCPASRREPYLRCEHMAAAAYAMQQYALQQHAPAPVPPPREDVTVHWESRLSTVLGEAKPAKARKPRSVLLFSLQDRYAAGGWKLTPYTLPVSLLDEDMLGDRAAMQAAIPRLLKHYEIKEVSYYGQLPANPLYSTPELCSLAKMVGMSNAYQVGDPLAAVLPQLRDALLFYGVSNYYGNPFERPVIQVDADPRPLQLTLEQHEAGSRLLASLPDEQAALSLTAENTRVICSDPLWILTGDRLLRVEGDGTLLTRLLQASEIVIPQAAKKTFITRYLPKLLHRAAISGDAIGVQEALNVAPVRRVYLREAHETINAEIAFAYGAYEVPLDTSWPRTTLQHDEERDVIVTIHRDTDAEEHAWRAMSEYGMKREGESFVLKQRVSPFDFLLRQVPKLQADGFEVFGEDAIKSARVNRNEPKMRLVVSSGIDWFDVLAVVSYGELDVTLSEVRKAIKQRLGYVKLPDGSMGMLPEEWLDRYRQLFAMGEATEQGVRLSKTQATLLELSLKDADDVQVDEEYTRRIERLQAFTQIEKRTLPSGFRGELRQYQRAGYDWLHFLHDYGFGGCLADDMGIGKTVQTLVFLQSLYADGHTAAASLIVMPRSLLENWAREAARFTPNLKVLIHADGDRSDDHASFDDYHLVLTTYGVMLRDLAMFDKYRFHYLVLDEAQAIKNPAAQSARAARMLRGDHRLALTGTPVENSTEELWSLFAFLNPGQLGSQEAFREHFATPIQRNQDEAAANTLRALVHPFILRRTKEQVAPELPPRTERLIYCEMLPAQRKLYQRTRDKYRAELLGLIDEDGMQQARFKVLEGLLRLRQLANDPRLIDPAFKGMSSKFEALLESLEVLREEGHKALVFSQFTSMLGLLRTALDERDWPYLYLDGKTTHRQELVDRFQEDESIPFFLISLKAGGLGLNLTAADYVIHIDPWWNPAVERQATDRTHRIGQERPVMIYKFIAEETVEEKILQLQEKKQALVDQLISVESGFMKSLTRDDVASLFT